MTVQELIEHLGKIEDKNRSVVIAASPDFDCDVGFPGHGLKEVINCRDLKGSSLEYLLTLNEPLEEGEEGEDRQEGEYPFRAADFNYDTVYLISDEEG